MRWEETVCGSKSCKWNKMDLCCSVMCLTAFGVSLAVVFAVTPTPKKCQYVTYVSREKWEARKEEVSTMLKTPVNMVFVHQTGTDRCVTSDDCKMMMRHLQSNHIDTMGMDDIGYSYVVGENGWVYEGRGWNITTEHMPEYDGKSISIALMGEFNNTAPNKWAMKALKSLLACGVEDGHLSEQYKLYTRKDTNSPIDAGEAISLQVELKTLDNYDSNPPN